MATWLGCAVAPDPVGLNSVRGLQDGGHARQLLAARQLARGDAANARKANATARPWSGTRRAVGIRCRAAKRPARTRWSFSADGRTIYVAAWGTQSFFRLSRGATPPKRDEVPLGFRVDNIHWARDGSLFAVGQAQQGWKAVKIDPNTLAVRDVLVQADTPEFNAGTALVEVGDTLLGRLAAATES